MPEKFVQHILLDGLSVMHIPLLRVVQFQLLAQLPGDYLPYTVVTVIIIIIIIVLILWGMQKVLPQKQLPTPTTPMT